jgi:hypothetical protein
VGGQGLRSVLFLVPSCPLFPHMMIQFLSSIRG